MGMILVVVGAAQPGSPFTSKLPGSWIFGVPGPGAGDAGHDLVGIALVYGGIVIVLERVVPHRDGSDLLTHR